MKKRISKRYISAAAIGVCLALYIGLSCSLLLHNLGAMLNALGESLGLGNDAEMYARIFAQLKDAKLDLPSLPLLLLSIAMTTGLARLLGGKEGKKITRKSRILRSIATILIAFLGFAIILLITLWFTDVNGIRFGTVIRFLYSALQNGVF